MDLSIIIPSYNTKQLLDRCLSSIYTSLKGSALVFEVIVVDNASEDGSVEFLRKKYPRVQNISNKKNLGYGKANNQGIRIAKGEYILLLNTDIQALDHGVPDLFQFAQAYPASFIGGKLLNEDRTPQASAGPDYTLLVVFLMLFVKGDILGITRSSPDTVKTTGWVSGACLLGKKASFMDVGLFDEDIFMYMDEVEFLYRAKQKGYTTVFCPHARFIHNGAASSRTHKTPVVNIFRGLLFYYQKHKSIMKYTVLRWMLKAKAVSAIFAGYITGNKDLVQTYEEAYRMV